MKTQEFTLQRYDADEGKVFDWADLTQHVIYPSKEDGTKDMEHPIQEHLYAKTLFLGITDNINNYVEVDATAIEQE